jgi:superfamily II DNA/RNA helicase
MQLLENIMENRDNKVVIFSEWKKMFELVTQELEERGIDYVYLNGDLSTKERKRIISRYHDEKDLKIFLSTDSGGLGLNLQCANVIINLDLPWNPAKLEQRIARVYRLGQNQHAYNYNFISKDSIEHRIYHLLAFKKSVFSGTLDGNKDTVNLDEKGFMETVEELTEVDTESKKSHSPEKEKTSESNIKNAEEEEKEDFERTTLSEDKEKQNNEANNQNTQNKEQTKQNTKKKKENLFRKIGRGVKKFFKRLKL